MKEATLKPVSTKALLTWVVGVLLLALLVWVAGCASPAKTKIEPGTSEAQAVESRTVLRIKPPAQPSPPVTHDVVRIRIIPQPSQETK